MKTAIRIFSIYLIALSLVPCSDGGSGIVEIALHFFEIDHEDIVDHEQHSSNCGDDHCTTFCICNCCSSAVDYPAKLPLKIKPPAPIPSSAPIFTNKIILSTFTDTVWQPPRFS